jgi:hypothetical protein
MTEWARIEISPCSSCVESCSSSSLFGSGIQQMKTTDTALLGHVSRESLSAAALSDLWTMCTGILIQGRALDILVGGA